MGYAGEGEVDDIVDRAQAEVYEVTDRRTREDYAPLSEIMDGVLDEIEAIGNRDGRPVRRAHRLRRPRRPHQRPPRGPDDHRGGAARPSASRRWRSTSAGPRRSSNNLTQLHLQPGDDPLRDHHAAAVGRGQGAAQPHPQRQDERRRLEQAGPQDGPRSPSAPMFIDDSPEHDDDGDPGQGPPAQAAPRPAADRDRLPAADDLGQEGRVAASSRSRSSPARSSCWPRSSRSRSSRSPSSTVAPSSAPTSGR